MNRRGAALIVALLALLIAGALASAALATGHAQWRAGLSYNAAARAAVEVQSALDRYLAEWGTHRFDSLAAGAVHEVGGVQEIALRRRDSMVRLGPSLFQLRSVAEVGPTGAVPLARDAASLLIRLAPVALADSAVVIAPTMLLQDAARIDGSDHIPPGWEGRCPPEGSPVPLHLADSAPFARLHPDPRPLLHPTSGPDSVTVLHGGSQLVDGMYSGILWVRGSLELSGNSYFAGVMLVEGSLLLVDQARVDGVVLAESEVVLSDRAEINYSSCALRVAFGSNPVVPRPVSGGWWRLD
jgi:hypothetical protein